MSDARYQHNLAVISQGKDAPTALTQAALYELSPESTQFGQKQLERDEKRKQLEEKNKKTIDTYRDQVETGLRAIDRIRKNIADGTLPETGFWGELLKRIPQTDAYELDTDLQTLKGILGFEGLMNAKLQSPNGASGFGSLSNDELRMLQGLRGELRQGGSKSGLLTRLDEVERYLKKGLTLPTITDEDLDAMPSVAASTSTPPLPPGFVLNGGQ